MRSSELVENIEKWNVKNLKSGNWKARKVELKNGKYCIIVKYFGTDVQVYDAENGILFLYDYPSSSTKRGNTTAINNLTHMGYIQEDMFIRYTSQEEFKKAVNEQLEERVI